ncbi:MAG: PQQ-binding-like beta-propeller repeat protein [Saprospiraceae bacterium]|jgi:outer membrane protein assembly factor BamB|nr:PQQ-binding-like beta-propeller repeat protein [Saprospiraceae bacterium]
MFKHLTTVVLALLALQISLAQVPDSCHPNTFLKLLGEPGEVENHSALCAAPDGNLYLAGLKGTRTAISKMTPDGEFLWTRSFLQPSFEPVIVAEIIVDSEGMIVGSGHRSRGVGARGLAFRYDPEANKMLWAYEFVTPMPVVDGGILEKTPGGNFLLYQNVFVDAQSKRPEILELNRTTGQVVPGFAYRYSLANYDQSFTSLAIRDGALYASGYGVGLFNARRFLLIKIDATTGQVLRGEAGHHSWVKPSYFSGGDMILDDTSVVMLYHGSETTYDINDGSGNPVPLYLQKNALSGETLWARKYMVSTLPKEVVAVPDGYVILGGDTDRYLLKTDKQGNLLTSKRLANPPFLNGDNGEQQNQMVLLGGHLFVADVAPTSAADQYTTLLKTDLNLDIEFECSRYQPWLLPDSVAMELMTNYPMSASASTTTQQAIALSPTPDPVTVRESCPFCPETPDSCQPTTFLRIYGAQDKYEYMTALRAAPDGNLYLAGRKGTGMAIAKMAPDGTFLWVRTTTVPQEEIRIGEIIVDSEGMIVGSGHTDISSVVKGFAFRYDPATDQVIWAHKFDSNQATDGGILEKSPGGNFLLYQNPRTTGFTTRTGEVLELDRATGQIVPAFARRYALKSNQNFTSMVQHGGALYATGFTDTVQNFATSRRMVLTKLDAVTGNVVWSRTGLTNFSQASYFSAGDILVDDSSLIVLYHGIETSNTINGAGKVVPVYLQKTTLDGQVLWVKKFLFPAEYPVLPRDILAVPDGYIIWCGYTSRHLLKTDKDGNLLVSKILDSSNYFYPSAEDLQNNQIERIGSHLFFGLFTARYGQLGHYTTVLKTDLNLNMDFDCGLAPYPVEDSTVLNPVNFAAQQTVSISAANRQPVAMAFAPGSMTLLENCPFCADLVCTDKPDLSFRIESVGCDSAAFVAYRLCNTGKQPYSGPLNVGVYDSNPLTSAATLLDLFSLQIDSLQPDSCQTGTLPNLAYWGNYAKVYTLAGIESGQSTPVDPAGFPYNGIAECDYANNLDSLVFQYPPTLPLDLGPNTGICPGDSLLLGAGLSGFVSYTWQDGSHSPTYLVTHDGIFTLTTTDGCGRTSSDSLVISLKNQPQATREIVLLPGDSVIIGGMVYKTNAQVISYEPSSTGGCDTLVTNNIRLDSLHCDKPGSFFKSYKGMNGRVIVPAADGGYYICGGTSQGLTFAKFDTTGKHLWVRQFGQVGNVFVQTLIEDSEGMLVGSTTSDGSMTSILVFRYSPSTDQMLWIKRYSLAFEDMLSYEVVEKKPGGDYLLAYLRLTSVADFTTEMVTFDRATGNIAGSAWHYSKIAALTSIEVNQDTLYAFGVLRDTSVGGFEWRNGLMKIDMNTGMPFWAISTQTPGADLFGGSLVLDHDGSLVSTMTQSGLAIWIKKNTPNGDLLWLKKIEILDSMGNNPVPLGLVRVNDGYAIGIQTRVSTTNLRSYIVVKTDKNGNLLWAKKVPTVVSSFLPSPHQLAGRGTEICFTTNISQQVSPFAGTILGKFDKYGNLGEGCALAEDLPVTIVPYPGSQVPPKVEFAQITVAFNSPALPQSVPLSVSQYTFCSRCGPCDSIAVQQTIEFYPGDTISLGGTDYTQSDTVVQTLPTAGGCDSVVTYILKLVVTDVDLVCPPDQTVSIPANQSSVAVAYPQPAAATDCPDPGIILNRLQGPPSGGLFSVGTTLVCYEAANQCNIRDTCCFSVTVQKTVEETACDVKIPPGSCIKYELLSIRLDASGNPRYRMRLTNTCASPLKFAYFQLPGSMTAKSPANGAVYAAPGGNTYEVRNPNLGPFRSIRFKPLAGDLKNGESDIFEYTLPKQAQMAFILVSAKLEDGTSSEAHINTFSCPVQPYVASVQEPATQERNTAGGSSTTVLVRPNPTSGLLFVEIAGGQSQSARIQVLNAQGQLVLEGEHTPGRALHLPAGLANGLYFLLVQPADGSARVATRFVLER